jgi:hypothetical protein
VFRVDPKGYADPAKGAAQEGRFGGYKVTATGKDQDAQFAARAAGLILDSGNFELDMAKGCKFEPGVGLRFWKGEEAADLLFCFKCDELKVVAPDPKGQGVQTPYADFGPGRAKFVRLVQDALPDDEVIRGLKD